MSETTEDRPAEREDEGTPERRPYEPPRVESVRLSEEAAEALT